MTPRQVLDAGGYHHVSVRIIPPLPDRERRFTERDYGIVCTMAARQPTAWQCEGVLRRGDDVTMLVSTPETHAWAAQYQAVRDAADALLRKAKAAFGEASELVGDLDRTLAEWWGDAYEDYARRLDDERLRREGW